MDFRVQRGMAVIGAYDDSVTLTAHDDYVPPPDLTRGFVITSSAASLGAGSAYLRNEGELVVLGLQSPADLTASFEVRRRIAGGAYTATARTPWEIPEYIGPVGGANEWVVRATGSLTFATGDLTATSAALTGSELPTDDSDVVVLVTGAYGGNYQGHLVTSAWDAANDQVVLTRGTTGDTPTISYVVLEFTGSNWSVQAVDEDVSSGYDVATAITDC